VLKVEGEKLDHLVTREKDQISTLEGVLNKVKKLETLHASGALDLSQAKEAFSTMAADHV